MAHPSVYDLEWEVLLRSGRLRAEFNRLRQQIDTLTQERNEAREEAAQLRAQNRFGRTPQPAVAPAAPAPAPRQSPRPAPAPIAVAPEPVVEEAKEPVKDLDDAAARFSLLELD